MTSYNAFMPNKPPPINKSSLKHLAELARIKLTAKEEGKFLKDLQKILKHFEELKAVDTTGVEPMTGGHELKNILRDDEIDLAKRSQSVDESGRIIAAFPEVEKGYLKVPKIL